MTTIKTKLISDDDNEIKILIIIVRTITTISYSKAKTNCQYKESDIIIINSIRTSDPANSKILPTGWLHKWHSAPALRELPKLPDLDLNKIR